jgi:hypothetical protein
MALQCADKSAGRVIHPHPDVSRLSGVDKRSIHIKIPHLSKHGLVCRRLKDIERHISAGRNDTESTGKE